MNKGGFGGGGLGNLVKQAQQMQLRIQKVQEEMAAKTAEGSAGGGTVTVVTNGKNEIVSIQIKKEALNPDDADVLQDMILEAANQALKKSSEMMNEAMSKVTGGMSIPGMF